MEGTGALSRVSFIRTLILCHLLGDYFYKRITRSSALPLSKRHHNNQRAETLWKQSGKKKNESTYGVRPTRQGSLARAGSKRPLSWHLVQLSKGPGGCQWLKALWAPPPVKSQLDSRAVFLTLTRSVIKRYWSLTLPLSLQALQVGVKGHIILQHRLLGPSFCSPGLTGMMGNHPPGPWRPQKKSANHGP